MKKLVYLLVAVSLMLALVPAVALAHTEDDPHIVTLLAGQTEDIGDVKVWNDADNLYVKFVSTGDCLLETHVAVATSLADIPQTKKGNPIPGQFEFSDPHACVQEYTYEIPLTWPVGTDLYIAAHAATGVQESMWVYSNGDENFTAYTGPGTTGYPCEQGEPRSGTAVAAWQHPAWGSVTSQFDYGTWIWEAYRAQDPICGTVVDFEETFDIPGEFTDGTLWVTADNGYKAYLNGTLLETDGLNGDWRNSPLTESYVTTAQAAWSSIEIATWLQLTGNTLRFETANEYFNTDDGHGSAGTVDSNPGGLIYEAEITYYADGETAWGAGTRFTEDKNWATYFTYTVQEPPPPKLTGYEVVTSASLNYGDGGWAGWSVQNGKVVTGGGFELTGGPAAVSRPGLPGETTPFGYTYGPDEYGWLVRDAQDGNSSPGSKIYVIYANMPAGYEVVTSVVLNYGDGGWGGRSCPPGKVVLGGGFDATGPVAVSRPGLPGETTPFGYTYGPDEYGWLVRDAQDGAGNTITIYAICANKLAGYEVVTSASLNYGDGGWAGWSVQNGKVVTGGGFELTGGPAAVSRPGLPGETTPFGYTYGPDEYGWLVRDAQDGNSSPGSKIYVIYTVDP